MVSSQQTFKNCPVVIPHLTRYIRCTKDKKFSNQLEVYVYELISHFSFLNFLSIWIVVCWDNYEDIIHEWDCKYQKSVYSIQTYFSAERNVIVFLLTVLLLQYNISAQCYVLSYETGQNILVVVLKPQNTNMFYHICWIILQTFVIRNLEKQKAMQCLKDVRYSGKQVQAQFLAPQILDSKAYIHLDEFFNFEKIYQMFLSC